MENMADVEAQLKIALTSWYSRQIQNLNEDYFLYYRPSMERHSGKLFITNGNTIYNLAMPERINKGATIEQNFNKIRLQGILNRLPILSI